MITTDHSFHLVDTHCHISCMLNKTTASAFSTEEIQEVRKILYQAELKNVTQIIEIGTSKIDSVLSIELSKIFKTVAPVIGVHPHEANNNYQDDILFLKNLLNLHSEKIVGIGECGLDKHYPEYNLDAQINLFKGQIELALEYDKALVVHTRDAEQETFKVLEEYKNQLKRVTIHCYSNSLDFAQEVTSWGWHLGIGGTVTYPKNNLLREIVQSVGLQGIVLETDAPYLAPQIVRGKPNSPEQIHNIAQFIAELLGATIEDVAAQTTSNAEKLFRYRE